MKELKCDGPAPCAFHRHVFAEIAYELTDRERRQRKLFRESPKLAATGDRRLVVEIHRMDVAASLSLEAHRDHLPRFGVVPESGRIGHSDELVLDERLGDRQRLGHDLRQRRWIRPVPDDEKLAIDKPGGNAGFVSGIANARFRTSSAFVERSFADSVASLQQVVSAHPLLGIARVAPVRVGDRAPHVGETRFPERADRRA